jgi:glyoxylase-like metal-dependent hydrolase (beta-lactamase superfamily II)
MMANVYFVANEAGGWVLVDTGLRGYGEAIRRAGERLFGSRGPSAIVLTHGHFDHVGGLPALANQWAAPVYAHRLELPYLTGRSSYPPPDPTVGGGLWSLVSPAFPRGPIDLRRHVHSLPSDESVPGLQFWRWIHTPGHSPGHVSLFREEDRTLLAGDAVVTTRQEAAFDVLTQRPVVWRPPAYFTTDWVSARRSVQRLAMLEPEVLAAGHGRPMHGPTMRRALHELAFDFWPFVPARGRYVDEPAIATEAGVVHVPRRPAIRGRRIGLGLTAVGAGLALALFARRRHA